MSQGSLAIVLHAHLPFVRHPEHPTFLEEDWLFEAITECYLPLIAVLRRLAEDEVPCRLTLSISPPLAEMLDDTLLQTRYRRHLQSRMELADQEVERTRHDLALQPLAVMYRQLFGAADRLFEHYRGNLLSAFRQLQDEGLIEIITCPATHAFLPFVSNEEARRAQLVIARETCEHHFGKTPRGLWLAECGYEPGLEPLIRETGFEYFVLDAHGLLFGNPRPPAGIYVAREDSRRTHRAGQGFGIEPAGLETHREATPEMPTTASSTAISDTTDTTSLCALTCMRTVCGGISASSTTALPDLEIWDNARCIIANALSRRRKSTRSILFRAARNNSLPFGRPWASRPSSSRLTTQNSSAIGGLKARTFSTRSSASRRPLRHNSSWLRSAKFLMSTPTRSASSQQRLRGASWVFNRCGSTSERSGCIVTNIKRSVAWWISQRNSPKPKVHCEGP